MVGKQDCCLHTVLIFKSSSLDNKWMRMWESESTRGVGGGWRERKRETGEAGDKLTHTKQHRFDNQLTNKGRKFGNPYPFKPVPIRTFCKIMKQDFIPNTEFIIAYPRKTWLFWSVINWRALFEIHGDQWPTCNA